MVTKEAQTAILAEYNQRREILSQWTGELTSLLGKLFPVTNGIIHSINGRTKGEDSLRRKLLRPDKFYRALSDVTDVVGIRIIVYFSDHVDKVAETIRGEFSVDYNRSVDKRALLDPDRFGYLSLHYVVALTDDRANLLEYKKYSGIMAEIQIRSILQHSWAEIDHDLDYKSLLAVPKEIRRDFSRIAGLLELADSEFVRIRTALDAYREIVGERIDRSPSEVSIDKISLVEFAKASEVVRALDREMAKESTDGQISDNPQWIENYVDHLYHFGIRNISSLEKALKDNAWFLKKYARERLSEQDYFQLLAGVSVAYLPYALAGRRLNVRELLDYFEKFNLYVGRAEEEKRRVAEFVVRLMKEQAAANSIPQADG